MIGTETSWIRVSLFWGGLLFFLILELFVPYRKSTVSKAKRWVHNVELTIFNTVFLQLLFAGAIVSTAAYVANREVGVLNMVSLPAWANVLVTVVFMDFMLYVWHLLNHEVPFLWRFHRVHHSDLNMDVSTATRFHIGELAISTVIKISLVFFTGAPLLGVLVFECALVLCAQFHHSSLAVPGWFEKIFWVFFVPPSMHRIHHSVVIKERNTNYGTIFSTWDRAMGTLLMDVDQTRIRIGVGAYQKPGRLDFRRLLVMPFTRPIR
ncbi:MAG: sterol desaturase family protein [Thermodesulfobacteriota bacterium]|nr:sterol desaturase family protein [Thermodesulfobacteriota bacterium]